MKTIRFFLLGLAGLAALGVGLLRATDPGPPPTATPRTGKVLVLKNERTMEGDVEQVGDRYRLRRQAGETWIPADAVLCLCASLPDAYAYLRKRANLEDADERLRLAGWCLRNGLRPQALAEVQAAVDLRPDHEETRRLLHRLQHSSQTAAPPPPAPAREEELPEPPPVELTAESLGLFATRVQPILMNACAGCHAAGRGGSFRLVRAYDGPAADRRTLQHNLAAVLREINVSQPEASLLLTKAVSDHGRTGQAPLRSRKDPPYRSLEDWVKRTVADNPQLRDRPGLPSRPAGSAGSGGEPVPPRATEGRPPAGPETQWGADTHPAPSPAPTAPAAQPPPPSAPPSGPPDPYDPEPFNRQVRPDRK
jgi:hypothetical protein